MGLVLELHLPGMSAALYEQARSGHAHFVCRACGRIEDVDCDVPADAIHSFVKGRDGEVEEIILTVHGRCMACRTDGGTRPTTHQAPDHRPFIDELSAFNASDGVQVPEFIACHVDLLELLLSALVATAGDPLVKCGKMVRHCHKAVTLPQQPSGRRAERRIRDCARAGAGLRVRPEIALEKSLDVRFQENRHRCRHAGRRRRRGSRCRPSGPRGPGPLCRSAAGLHLDGRLLRHQRRRGLRQQAGIHHHRQPFGRHRQHEVQRQRLQRRRPDRLQLPAPGLRRLRRPGFGPGDRLRGRRHVHGHRQVHQHHHQRRHRLVPFGPRLPRHRPRSPRLRRQPVHGLRHGRLRLRRRQQPRRLGVQRQQQPASVRAASTPVTPTVAAWNTPCRRARS